MSRGKSVNRADVLSQLKKYKDEHSDKYGISDFGIFGSVAREETNPSSDIDIFIQTNSPNPFIIVAIKEELESIFHKHIDIIRIRKDLNPLLRQRIDKEGIRV